jgi:hypothetical protein
VAVVLLLLVPAIVARSAIESADAPDALDLLSAPFVASELSYRIFGEIQGGEDPIGRLSTWVVAGGLVAWTLAGAAACWLRYRRIEADR